MSAERCNCGTHTKAACDFAGACGPVTATLPAAAAPIEQQDELPITRSTYGTLEACEAEQARRNAAPTDCEHVPYKTKGGPHDDDVIRCAKCGNYLPVAALPAEQAEELPPTNLMTENWSGAPHTAFRHADNSRYTTTTYEDIESVGAALAARQVGIDRVIHDFPALQAFHEKHALGPMLAPSCLCCGQQTHPVMRPAAIKHGELPGIVICETCRNLAARPAPEGKAEPFAWIIARDSDDEWDGGEPMMDKDEADDYMENKCLPGWHLEALYRAAPLPRQAAVRGEWSDKPPTEQAWYWHWNGNQDDAPFPLSVLYSGTAKKCFVSMGQVDEGAVFCDVYGGYWLRMIEPSITTMATAPDQAKGAPATTKKEKS
jgi:hypothetical protein